jgi:hypothetical protein
MCRLYGKGTSPERLTSGPENQDAHPIRAGERVLPFPPPDVHTLKSFSSLDLLAVSDFDHLEACSPAT